METYTLPNTENGRAIAKRFIASMEAAGYTCTTETIEGKLAHLGEVGRFLVHATPASRPNRVARGCYLPGQV